MQTVKNKTGLKVLTPYGYKSFAGIRRQEKECFEILCDTTSLSATADHKIYTDKVILKLFMNLNQAIVYMLKMV